ncbi:DsbC family protein [Psychrobacter sp.]|uniref:DsbC family protein n=1 Tax=Psychrobacter sp. TaxID=56811 RepID=UPI0025E986D8|nr:DsbC family protein [Psychrobacter sp.]
MSKLLNKTFVTSTPKLSKMAFLALAVAITGCNSNITEAKQNNAMNNETATNTATNTSVKTDTASPESDASVVKAIEENLKASGVEQKIISAVPTSMQNIYWVNAEGSPAFYSDKEGRHIILGQILEVGKDHPVEISSALTAKVAKEKLAAVDKSEMIIYPAKGVTKAVVYSFTDADCPYCAKMHSEMNQINAEGIEVRYLAWPRSEDSVPKMEAIWCSADRKTAMDKAKNGEAITAPKCKNPVRSHMKLGLSLGVSGTPAVFTESGIQIGGYLPAKELAAAAINNS